MSRSWAQASRAHPRRSTSRCTAAESRVLERGEIASGASGVNAGMIDSTGWGDAPDLQAHLTAGSLDLFKEMALDHGEDIEPRQSGSVQAIHTAAQHDFARDRVAALRAQGHVIELLGIRDARSLEPARSPALLGAVYSPLRSQADPERATRAFARVAERNGARVLTDHEVTAIAPRPAGGRVVPTTRAEVVAEHLVIAAGAWCGPGRGDARSRHPDRPRARSDVGDPRRTRRASFRPSPRPSPGLPGGTIAAAPCPRAPGVRTSRRTSRTAAARASRAISTGDSAGTARSSSVGTASSLGGMWRLSPPASR